MTRKRTAIEECCWGSCELHAKARAEFRALMAAVRWIARQGQFTYADSTDKALARLRRLGLLPARKGGK